MVEAATSFVSGIKSTLTFMAASTTEHQQQNDPTNEAARYNYELLKKSLAQKDTQQQKDSKPPIEPSEFAKRIKEKADQLVAQQRYSDALQLLNEGLRSDKTVQAYNDYIQRLGTIVEIDQ